MRAINRDISAAAAAGDITTVNRLIEDQGPNGEPRCLVKVALERGAAQLVMLDSRFGIDTCATARRLATLITERSS